MSDASRHRLFLTLNRGALKIAGLYLVLGLGWILFSDQFVSFLIQGGDTFALVSIIKGWAYVIATAILLYGLIKAHTDAMREKEEQRQMAYRAGDIGTWKHDLQNGVVYLDERSQQHCGFPPKIRYEEFIARIHPDDVAVFKAATAQARKSRGTRKSNTEFRIIQNDGTVKWVSIQAKAYFKKQVRKLVPIQTSGVLQDITLRKTLDNQKDEFLAIASHELKTPLTSLKAYNQVLMRQLQDQGGKNAQQILQKMDKQMNKLTKLIADLLDVSKVQSGKLQYLDEKFDFNTLVKEVLDDLGVTAMTHPIQLKLAASRFIYGDRDRFGQVIINFIHNAIKYSPPGSQVHVFSQVEPGWVKLSVKDNGMGIPKKEQTEIFRRFYRVADIKNSTTSGLGLGLFICSEIITRHHGTIGVESKVGQGSTFFFRVPIYSNTMRQKNLINSKKHV